MITSFEGLPGAGKTLSMVMYAYRYWKEYKTPVFANFSLRFPLGDYELIEKKWCRLPWYLGFFGREYTYRHPGFYYPKVIQGENLLTALLQLDRALVLIDEAGTVFDNRSWKNFPKSAMAKFRESRKCQLEIMYTAQSIQDVDLKLRRLTNYLVQCKFEKFFGRDLFLRNWCYYSQVIRSETPQSKKEWLAWHETCLWKEFQKYYPMYDTLERIRYDIPEGKELISLFRKNSFEPVEVLQGAVSGRRPDGDL